MSRLISVDYNSARGCIIFYQVACTEYKALPRLTWHFQSHTTLTFVHLNEGGIKPFVYAYMLNKSICSLKTLKELDPNSLSRSCNGRDGVESRIVTRKTYTTNTFDLSFTLFSLLVHRFPYFHRDHGRTKKISRELRVLCLQQLQWVSFLLLLLFCSWCPLLLSHTIPNHTYLSTKVVMASFLIDTFLFYSITLSLSSVWERREERG